jgi:hypothetical protein
LEIQFPEEILTELGNSWVFLNLQEDVLKMSLIMEIEKNPLPITSFINNNEYRFPELIKPLFIDESFVLQDEQITFQDSEVAKNIRYYNFANSANDKAVDWGIINEKYLILSTSKEAAIKLTEDLEMEENLSDISNKIEINTTQN